MCIQQLVKTFHITEDLRLIPYFGLGVASVSENCHLACPLTRSYMRKNIKILTYSVFLRFQEFLDTSVTSLTVTFWPPHSLGLGKVAVGNSFVWILSILMCIQTFTKKHMLEELRRLIFILSLFKMWHFGNGIG